MKNPERMSAPCQLHELSPTEAALFLVFNSEVQAAVAAYLAVVPPAQPRDYANPVDGRERNRVKENLRAALADNQVSLLPVERHGFDISLSEFVTEFTAHRNS